MMASNGVDSYKHFLSAQKVKLSVLYPFLSQEQIKGKIKKRWQALKAEDKSINKTPLKPTSPKCRTKGLKSSAKKSQMKIDSCVSDTPEFINTHKLQDFRKRHGKTYKNDFLSSTGASQNSRSEMELSQDPGEDTWTFDGTSSGNGSCSDDDAVLIKRNFDADGNIVNDDDEVEQNTGTDDQLVANPDIESENGELVDNKPKEGETNLPDMKGQEEINNNKLEDKKSFQNVNTEDNVDISTKMTRTKRKRLSPQKNVECKKVKSLSLQRRRGGLHTSVEQDGIDNNVSDDDVISMNHDKENMVKKMSKKQKQVLSSGTDSNQNSPCNGRHSKSSKQPNQNLDALKSNPNKCHDKNLMNTEEQIDVEEHYNHTMDQDENNNKCVTDDETVKESPKHKSSKKSKQNMTEINKEVDKDKTKNSNELHNIEDMKPSGDASTAAERSKRTSPVIEDKQKQNEDVHQTTDEEVNNIYDSDDTTPQSMSAKSDKMPVKKRTNSTLERILSNLRSTGMQSSSSGCEPSSSSQDSSLSHVSNNMLTGYEMDIEEMFSDVASPTKNDRGQFKTTRMVTKSAYTDPQSMKEQFQQLFDEDSDFI